MEGTIGEVRMFAGNFAPRGWALCEGQLLAVSQNNALFSILGTMYGGDGRSTFGLPDLRGRAPIGVGRGPGLGQVDQGAWYGSETVVLSQQEIPAHTHSIETTVRSSSQPGNNDDPEGSYWADPSNNVRVYRDSHDSTMAADAVSATAQSAGGNQPHENRPPSLGINFIICMEGVYPSRS